MKKMLFLVFVLICAYSCSISITRGTRVVTSTSPVVMQNSYACQFSNNDSLWFESFAQKSVEEKQQALEEVTDICMFQHIAYFENDPSVRMKALSRLSSQTALQQVAFNDPDTEIRSYAVHRLSSQTALQHISFNEKDTEIRKYAVSRLSSLTALRQVVATEENPEIRNLAIKMLQ